MTVTISAEELAAALREGTPVQILDVRYRLDRPDGREEFAAGHIPSAMYVDMDSELAEHGAPEDGRHPVPSTERLQAATRRWGIHADDNIVVVDNFNMMGAARAWWLLRGAGLNNVRVLDGGMKAWERAGGELEKGEGARPAPSDIVIETVPQGISRAQAAEWSQNGVLADVRVAERYRGETEPIDPIAGHIPGAKNLPSSRLYTAEGMLREPAEIRAAFDEVAGAKPLALYCGSGITAAQAALAAASVGRDAEVYVGSWSAWSNTPGAAIATGDE